MEFIPVEVKIESTSDDEDLNIQKDEGYDEFDEFERQLEAMTEKSQEKSTETTKEHETSTLPRGIASIYTKDMKTRPLNGDDGLKIGATDTIPKAHVNAQGRIECLFCNKTFISHGTYRLHEKVHTGRGAYNCQICGKVFGQRSHFVDHVAVHSNIRPFECELCPSRFKEKNTLRRHQQRRHLMFGFVHKPKKGKNVEAEKKIKTSPDNSQNKSATPQVSPIPNNNSPKKFIRLPKTELTKLANAKIITLPPKPVLVRVPPAAMNLGGVKYEIKRIPTPPPLENFQFIFGPQQLMREIQPNSFEDIKNEPEDEERSSSPVFSLQDFLSDD